MRESKSLPDPKPWPWKRLGFFLGGKSEVGNFALQDNLSLPNSIKLKNSYRSYFGWSSIRQRLESVSSSVWRDQILKIDLGKGWVWIGESRSLKSKVLSPKSGLLDILEVVSHESLFIKIFNRPELKSPDQCSNISGPSGLCHAHWSVHLQSH